MKSLIHWLMKIESITETLYRKGSEFFGNNDLGQFLHASAKDEAFHFSVMQEALETVEKHPDVTPAFVMDLDIKDEVEASIEQAIDRVENGTLDRNGMIDCIVKTEYSEWNALFLYVINRLVHQEPKFKSVAAELQRHMKLIQHFLKSDSYGRRKVDALEALQAVWSEKVLVIEDDPALSELMVSVLKADVDVDTAPDGQMALEKIRRRYYRMIISDIHLPIMDGLTVFRKAVTDYPTIADRYLFYTGIRTDQIISFLADYDVTCLQKPIRLMDIKKRMLDVMYKSPEN